MNERVKEKIEVVEMWFLRRTMKISWMKRVSKEKVKGRAGTTRSLFVAIRKQQLNFIDHILRKRGLEKLTIEGRIERKRARSGQRIQFMEGLASVIDIMVVDILRRTGSNAVFKRVVGNIRL